MVKILNSYIKISSALRKIHSWLWYMNLYIHTHSTHFCRDFVIDSLYTANLKSMRVTIYSLTVLIKPKHMDSSKHCEVYQNTHNKKWMPHCGRWYLIFKLSNIWDKFLGKTISSLQSYLQVRFLPQAIL